MGWIQRHIRRTAAAGLALMTGAALLATTPAAAADGMRAACDEILAEAWNGINNGVVATPNGVRSNVLSDIEPGLDNPNQPAWHPSGEYVLFTAKLGDSFRDRVDVLATAAVDGSERRIFSLDIELDDRADLRDPAWSPDGSRLALAVEDAPGDRLLTADADGTNAAFVEFDLPGTIEFPRGPAWSPDGTRIASSVIIDGDQHIVVSDPDGSNAIAISAVGVDPPTGNGNPAWSPDGSRIVWNGRQGFFSSELFVADADGSNRALITDDGVDPTDNAGATWSPDGSRIAWRGTVDSTRVILTSAPDGSDRTDVSSTGDLPSLDVSVPRWSHDGTKLLWEAGIMADGPEIDLVAVIVADADGSDRVDIRVNLNEDPDRLRLSNARWSPVDDSILWSYNSRYFVSDDDGSDRVLITDDAGLIGVEEIRWSPDGETILATGTMNGVEAVVLLRADGTVLWSSDVPGGNPEAPTWHPDGSSFIWYSSTSGGQVLWSTDVATKTRTRLLPDDAPGSENPVWDPDGTRVLLDLEGDELDGLHWFTIETGTFDAVEPISDLAPSRWGDPSISPDGDQLALSGRYDIGDDNHWGLFVVDLATMQASEISPAPVGEDPPGHFDSAWSPDGETLVWSTETADDDSIELAVSAGVDGSDYQVLSDPAAGDAYDPVWSPDGTRIAWTRDLEAEDDEGDDIEEIVIVDVDGTVLSRISQDATGVEYLDRPRWRPRAVTPFTDMPDTSFAVDDVTCIYGMAITQGTSATTYGPTGEVTREQMAAFLGRMWRALGNDCETSPAHGFTDVSPTSFADDDISCIKNLGITTGTSATTYSPAANVTREQMAAFLGRMWRALGNDCPDGPDHGFTDVSPTSFADDDISCIKNLGITTGTSATTYSPAANVTREQMAAFLGRLIRRHTEG